MSQRQKFEYIILQLKYEYICAKNKLATCIRNCQSPSEHIPDKKDWALSVLKRDKDRHLCNALVNYTIWIIPVNNVALLTTYGYSFDKVLLIFGYNKIYWTYYDDHHIVQGSSNIAVTCCGCCLNRHYPKIVKKVQTCLKESKFIFTDLIYINGTLQVPDLRSSPELEEM
uniref:Uncharacterized protein n=1 Tax=Glossina palpalis gambiensis TaxID=67801 RepID=A0A1B0B4U7_9MUSC